VIAPDARVEEHRNLGMAFYKTGMLDEAEREFRRVVDLRASDMQARFFLGLVHLRLSRWDDAIADFEHAAHQRGAMPAVLHNLAFAFERKGEAGKALDALREAVKRGGDRDARVHTSLGVLALREGDLAAAEASFVEARPFYAGRAPSPAWFHYAALCYALGGKTNEAAALLQEGVEAYPHAAVLHNNLSVVLERAGRDKESLAAAERGVSEDAGIAQLHKNIGDAHYRVGLFDEAYDAYQRAVKFNDVLGPDVWLKLGNIRLKRNERDAAVKCWEHALQLDPANQTARMNIEAAQAAS
jgi:tetratricopeptide (TPR) repeat protein